ncbi:MAG: hypothetical protein ABWZ82_07635, partial [Candidatus Limnocylindrales bacterium]
MTEVAEASPPASPRPRPARRGVGELSYRLDPEAVERLAAGGPAWLAEDRRAALEAFGSLPIEPNQLYTSYVDLRGADLGEVVAYEPAHGTAHDAPALPDGTAVMAAFVEGGAPSITIADAAERAGVRVEPLAAFVERDPEAARALL